jgi:hypothetical protein
MTRHILTIVFLFLFVGCNKQPDVYNAGFMYWYGPTLLQTQWHAVLTGTVTSVSMTKAAAGWHLFGGELRIERIVFSKPTRDLKTFSADIMKCNGGFDRLSKGDKVLVFLIEYEGEYSIPDYQGSSCSLGVKLKTFNDPIIEAAKRFGMKGLIEEADQSIWKHHDPQGLAYRLEIQSAEQGHEDCPGKAGAVCHFGRIKNTFGNLHSFDFRCPAAYAQTL